MGEERVEPQGAYDGQYAGPVSPGKMQNVDGSVLLNGGGMHCSRGDSARGTDVGQGCELADDIYVAD